MSFPFYAIFPTQISKKYGIVLCYLQPCHVCMYVCSENICECKRNDKYEMWQSPPAGQAGLRVHPGSLPMKKCAKKSQKTSTKIQGSTCTCTSIHLWLLISISIQHCSPLQMSKQSDNGHAGATNSPTAKAGSEKTTRGEHFKSRQRRAL